jgi:mutator protein MutT
MDRWEARPQRVVVAAFLEDGGEVLLARRAVTKAVAPGKYHLPGGHVEFGEHPEEALARELREELNVAVTIGEVLWAFAYCQADAHTVGLVYHARMAGSRADLLWAEDDFSACVWVPESRLGEFLAADDHNFQAATAGFARLRAGT